MDVEVRSRIFDAMDTDARLVPTFAPGRFTSSSGEPFVLA